MADILNMVKKKEKLLAIAGEAFPKYLEKMREYYAGKLTKEELDAEVWEFLPPEGVHYHNELFLLVHNVVSPALQTFTEKNFYLKSSTENANRTVISRAEKRLKTSHGPSSFGNSFRPVSVSNYLPTGIPPKGESQTPTCTDWLCLPDKFSIYGLMVILAWGQGIDFVHSDTIELMTQAVRLQIKTLVMSILSRKSAYKLRGGQFRYALGTSPINIYLQNAQKHYREFTGIGSASASDQKADPAWAESVAATEMACDLRPKKLWSTITPWDLFETLQVYRGIIPSHSVYTRAVECASAALYHPSAEELEQERVLQQQKELSRTSNLIET